MKSTAVLVFLAFTTAFALPEKAAQPRAPCPRNCPRDDQGICIACVPKKPSFPDHPPKPRRSAGLGIDEGLLE